MVHDFSMRKQMDGVDCSVIIQPMMTIAFVGVDHYRVPLPVVLSDSTHGDIAEFELVTVRVRDAAGREGLGYTYTSAEVVLPSQY